MTSETTTKLSTTPKLTTSAYTHIKAYPIISDSSAFLHKFQLYSLLKSYIDQLLTIVVSFITNFPLVVSILNRLDKTADTGLDRVDKTFPTLTSVSVDDVKKDITTYYDSSTAKIIKTVKTTRDSTVTELKTRLEPITNVSDHYQKVLTSYLDTTKTKADEYTEPYKEKVTKLYESLQPLVNQVTSYPSHINELYTSEKTSGSSTPIAIAKTSRRLSNEAFENTIKPAYLNTLKPTVDKFIGNAKVSANGVVDIVDTNVNKLGKEVDGVISSVVESVTDIADGSL
ncbi:hypothetical protein CANARDRAFT_27974 [[Candida] arabinofermentans NRRL YB-2248]|uniref:Uncharacterized protein n=1 Tax=[Candida] arabinofermentans NRRL YB-2248 TaxID=983967 RepID=A0A1E4T2E8_9ASCO|nr:hypothetical protein CANARDRAFT_27974 [[Candida] arabinofermentans NRRL YB-2248]